MPLAFYLDFATKQEGLRRFIDSKGLLTPRIGSLSCRPLPPSDNKGRDLAVIKQILHGYILSERKIRVPLLQKGNCLDNAIMENFFGLMKNELLYANKFESIEDFERSLRKYIDWYNNKRLKLRLKGMSPAQYRAHYYRELNN